MTPLTNQQILVATDDSPAGLEASRWAVDLAAHYGATLRVLHVLADSDVTAALVASGDPGLAQRRLAAVRSLFRHVSGLAATAGVALETVELEGEPAARILEQARSWPADPDGAGVRRAARPRRTPREAAVRTFGPRAIDRRWAR